MRILYFANNRLGWEILRWLKTTGQDIAGLVLHPPGKRKWGAEIREAAGLADELIFDGSRLGDPAVMDSIRELAPEVGLSVLFGYILRPPLLNLFPAGVLNLHPSYLPFNRGAAPNVWSIVEGTPAGATLHRIDAGVDTGEILAQQIVPVDPTDTGASLYRKLETASMTLFQRAWPEFLAGRLLPMAQPATGGTCHRMNDFERIDEIDLDRQYRARDLINVLRARSFPPHQGAYFRIAAKKVHMRLELEYGD